MKTKYILLVLWISFMGHLSQAQTVWVIPAQYDGVGSFSGGLAEVKQNGKWGFIDKTGQMVITPQFTLTRKFSDGLAPVQQDGKWGFINKSGKIVISPQFEEAYPFSEGLARIIQNKKCGFINLQGKVIIPIQYEDGGAFSENLAPVKKNGKWGYINAQNSWVISPKYESAQSFSEGYAWVGTGESNYGVINTQGQMFIPPKKYWSCSPFSEGYANITYSDRTIGFITRSGRGNRAGNETRSWRVSPFHDGLAVVFIMEGFSMEYDLLTKEGKLVGFRGYKFRDSSEDLLPCSTRSSKFKKWGFLDSSKLRDDGRGRTSYLR